MRAALAPPFEPLRPSPHRPASRQASATRRRQRAYHFGVDSERRVAAFLRAGDYKIISHRARLGGVEVDLIVADGDVVAFVEVKARRDGWDGLEAVTTKKMRRLTKAANAWASVNELYADCSIRFDIALVGTDGSIEYLENAFEAQPDDDFVF